jgi:3-hydroxyacyl-CoA dehydrogenase
MQQDIIERPLVTIARDAGIAVLTIDRPPVNALSQALRRAMAEALEALGADDGVKGVVLACAGRSFIAGAEISELGLPLDPGLPEVLDMIEGLGKPTVAALHGTALGGGFEVALACTWRVAKADTLVGLPEVKLGILPGSGGTVRTTWLAGAESALQLAGSGEMISAAKAQGLGLLDALTDTDPVAAATALLRERLASGDVPLPIRDRARPAPADPAAMQALCAALQKKLKSEAPALVLDSVLHAQQAPFDTALAHERALFLKAASGPTSAALRHLFFAERAAAKPAVDRRVTPRDISRVCVIGAGTMGRGIAMAFADGGYEVALHDMSDDALTAALAAISASYGKLASRGRLSPEEAEARRARITATARLETQKRADLFVEAAFEDMEVKKQIFARIDAIAKPGAVLATNTSYLDVNQIAQATSRPGDVVGLHFFSPANIMKLLEVVDAKQTSDDVLQTAAVLARRLKKQAVFVGVCRGFVGNRMLQARNRAVPDLLCEGAAPEAIDAAFRAIGWPMGPCEMQDLAGLDIGWRMRQAEGLSEPIGDALCETGRLGQKTGKGWYDYAEGRKTSSEAVRAIIAGVATARGITQRQIDAAEIIARTHDPMIAEGKALLAEGIARNAGDIDVVWVNGYGFPRDLGGPMHWAENRKDQTA